MSLKEKLDNSATHGGIFTNLTTKILREFSIEVPSIAEQKIIATLLSTMDSEIKHLEKQLQKTKALKQGMMQELLTGKTRLV
jgi:type I restriction enzyme S subunit